MLRTDFWHRIKTWHLLVAVVVFGSLSLVGLRANNHKMGQLKQAVLEADESGEGTYEALDDLASHIFSHMNTSTDVALTHAYDRAVEDALEKSRATSIDPQLYIIAEERCNNPNDPGLVRAKCVEDFITAQAPQGSNPQPLELPLKQNYQYSFVAPTWSFDAAGISVLLTLVSLGWLLLRVIPWLLRRRHHSS